MSLIQETQDYLRAGTQKDEYSDEDVIVVSCPFCGSHDEYVGRYYQYPSPWILDWKRRLGRSVLYWLSWPERACRLGSIGWFAPKHRCDRQEGRDAEPRRLKVVLALVQKLAQRRRARRQPEAQEIEGREADDGAAQDERQEGDGGDHGVGQDVLEHDLGVGYPQRAVVASEKEP